MGDVRPTFHQHDHHHPGAVAAPVWPVLEGQPVALASAFQPRQSVRDQVFAARRHGNDVVLAQHDGARGSRGARVLAGGGGVGKSQLAAWFAWQAIDDGSTDLVLWVTAGSANQVITAYARAAAKAGVLGADGKDPDGDAKALLEWLSTTQRPWLVVLDDVTDPAMLAGWWPPHRPAGWTLVTTRLQDDASLLSSGRQQVNVDVYSPDEALNYLGERLSAAGYGHLLDEQASDLAAVLGYLPLALSHAAAYMITQDEGCADYLARFLRGTERLADLMPPGADPDGYGRPVAVTLLLALEAAEDADPIGLARPALELAAVCDPDGHPDTLWATSAVTSYLSVGRAGAGGDPVDAGQARKTVRLLHRYGLLTHTRTNGARAVRIHALTARAMRETTANPALVAYAAADALLELWPALDHATTDLMVALRANTATVAGIANELLWRRGGHPLLYRAGTSLINAGLQTAAIDYWETMQENAARLLGEEHQKTLVARCNLAVSYRRAGRTQEAIVLLKTVVAAHARLLGDEHPETLTVRANLAVSYWQAGRTQEAIGIEEMVVADRVRLLGDKHPDTLAARANLAASYQRAGRTQEAISLLETVVADRVRSLGHEHSETLAARANLAASYWKAGRTHYATDLLQTVVADCKRLLGDEHSGTRAVAIVLQAWRGEA
ncbi:tetratricopeptide repeat protein [Micromonospora sp. STR1s_6]|uniref:Tetratricopeptide repeat protein n=1 Tax=Micromonospora tarensis TaxID=2806100 RepID=A0ABS1YF64_9ACTN|nr:tetratricopeptide repeat protein [Micromonospora tarensis]